MRLILNVIWLVLSGFWLFLGYLLAALFMFILIVTIPFGIASARIGLYSLWPFGKTIVDRPTAGVGARSNLPQLDTVPRIARRRTMGGALSLTLPGSSGSSMADAMSARALGKQTFFTVFAFCRL